MIILINTGSEYVLRNVKNIQSSLRFIKEEFEDCKIESFIEGDGNKRKEIAFSLMDYSIYKETKFELCDEVLNIFKSHGGLDFVIEETHDHFDISTEPLKKGFINYRKGINVLVYEGFLVFNDTVFFDFKDKLFKTKYGLPIKRYTSKDGVELIYLGTGFPITEETLKKIVINCMVKINNSTVKVD